MINLAGVNLMAQYRLTVPVNQMPELEVSSLEDLTATPGAKVMLGEKLEITGGFGLYGFTWRPEQLVESMHSKITRATIYESTTFTLVVNDISGCSDTVQQVVLVEPNSNQIRGIKETALVYPVPTHNLLHIKLFDNNSPGGITCHVYDVQGKVVFEKTFGFNSSGDYSINLRMLDPGTYTLLIGERESIVRRQIIVY
ncbi:MAG TPA: T9SS type A sorting domain-containing protein [Bacteroidales bacterium]|nr:T9SS type A sorting domain-containing protein [Bacteroidales bacterium]